MIKFFKPLATALALTIATTALPALAETPMIKTIDGVATLRTTTHDNIGNLHSNAVALKKIMHRHITDEEDIIMPIFLRQG